MVHLAVSNPTYFVNTRVPTFRAPLVLGKDEEVVLLEFFDTLLFAFPLSLELRRKSLLDLLSVSSPPRSSFGFLTWVSTLKVVLGCRKGHRPTCRGERKSTCDRWFSTRGILPSPPPAPRGHYLEHYLVITGDTPCGRSAGTSGGQRLGMLLTSSSAQDSLPYRRQAPNVNSVTVKP